MSIKMDLVKNKLQAVGLRLSYPRLRILSYLLETREHPTAEMIYQHLRRAVPVISRATVYNTLNVLVNEGVILPLNIEGVYTRFDGNIRPHHHFYCERCKKLYDLDIVCKYSYQKKIAGHEIRNISGYFQWICKNCLKRRR